MHTEANTTAPNLRSLIQVVRGVPTTDGAGVQLTRVMCQPALPMLDPFLLLDAFRSDRPNDYIAGFPPHPHRGFETVTYLLAGRMRHQDNAGHQGVIEAGGIQWMTAGRGIVHSEMPEQREGLLEGFQLWVNLPAGHKMDPPAYQEHAAGEIPKEEREGGIRLRVITGETSLGTRGPVVQSLTQPLYLDVESPPGTAFHETLPAEHNAFLYVIAGALEVADGQGGMVRLGPDELGILSKGDAVAARAVEAGTRFLLIAGRPLNEPVARGGPFVMNTEAEIQQAFADYRAGRM